MCWRFTERFASTLDAASLARSAVTAGLGAEPLLQVAPDCVDDLRLVVSELVSNAVNATAEGLLVLLELHRGYARVEVVDGSSELPRIGRPGPTESHGRGLLLVAALASEWGVDARPPGKAVWARLAIPARATERMACREA